MLYSEFQSLFRAIDRNELCKYRATFHGGRAFIDKYLVKFSKREDKDEFEERRQITYNTDSAAAAVMEIRNSIFKRSKDIVRTGGPANYREACDGVGSGVDLLGSSMSTFMGTDVLLDLLVAREVGIYVDKDPIFEEETLAESRLKRPYLYMYNAEDILAYEYDDGPNRDEMKKLLVRERCPIYDTYFGLCKGEKETFKYFRLEDGKVIVTPMEVMEPVEGQTEATMVFGETVVLNLKHIPFHLLTLPKSMLINAADAQIALLNLTSSDIWYLLKANFPFYVEPYDPKSEAPALKKMEDTKQPKEQGNKIRLGPSNGRKYPAGTNQPAFIAPPTDPIKASMERQEQIKREIREMVLLALTNITSSADSKNADKEKLEDGLAYIGRVLERAENRIGEYWAMYENVKPPIVKYPQSFHLISDTDSRENAKLDIDLAKITTSSSFRRALLKKTARARVGCVTTSEELSKIEREIDTNEVVLADWQEVAKDIENGLVGNELASQARGYPKGEAEKAAKDHAERLARIQASQTPKVAPGTDPKARGLNDLSGDPSGGRQEKAQSRDTTTQPVPTDNTRGAALA